MLKARCRRVLAIIVGLAASVPLLVIPAQATPNAQPRSGTSPIRLVNLSSDRLPALEERLPVNIVFVGFDRRHLSVRSFISGLPRRGEPRVRASNFYGNEQPLGIGITYDYRVRFARSSWEDAFFHTLKRLGRPAPLTRDQMAYNAQENRSRTIDSNLEIDAPTVERWLAAHPLEGMKAQQNTVYYINWFGRTDFRHHVYVKTNEPDPDTGHNFGRGPGARTLVAWGGTMASDPQDGRGAVRRTWFYDLSAGPNLFTGSYNVDDADLDGDDIPDYRIPPSWEYGAYRPKSLLTSDLAKVTRYVVIDTLFTASPLFDPALPAALPPLSIDLDNNFYEAWTGVRASRDYIEPGFVLRKLSAIRWRNRLSYDAQTLPFTGKARSCYDTWLAGEASCLPQYGLPAFADLYLYNQQSVSRTQDDAGRVDWEIPLFTYSVGADRDPPLLGYVDDNWTDGTQSHVYSFVSPQIVELGYGLTTTTTHEVGHYIGLSHPHDGFDSASETDFGPTGPFYFTWVGTQSNTMMSYIDLNWDFSVFDKDNSDRWLTATSLAAANRVLPLVLADADRAKVAALLHAADRQYGAAKALFARHRYAEAYANADRSYRTVVRAARVVGVDLSTLGSVAEQAPAAVARAAADRNPSATVDGFSGPRGDW